MPVSPSSFHPSTLLVRNQKPESFVVLRRDAESLSERLFNRADCAGSPAERKRVELLARACLMIAECLQVNGGSRGV
jgi:hypothetical protein